VPENDDINVFKSCRIRSDESLAVGSNASREAIFGKMVTEFGNFIPILVYNLEGSLFNLECEEKLKAMQKNGNDISNIILMPFDCQKDALLFALKWWINNKEGNNLNYSLLINKLLHLNVSRKIIIESVDKSESWVSKIISLSNNLNCNIIDLIRNKVLSARIAEPIARLPKEKQVEFSNNIINDKLNKNQVEKLVSHYINENTPLETKDEIIKSPSTAIKSIDVIKSRKMRPKVIKDKITSITNIFIYTLKHLETTKKTISELDVENISVLKNHLKEIADNCKTIYNIIKLLI
jgi:hypothetical protein